MTVTIHVNGKMNSLAHKGCLGITKSTLPDVCKTPSLGGPVPIPYPVIVSMANSLKKSTKNVEVDGENSAAIKGSEYSRCNGDESGTAGGVKSSTNMKEATWILYSFDVKLEKKNACRLSDKMMMNHGNTACLGGTLHAPVATGLGLGFNLMCSSDFAREHGLNVLAEIAAIGTAQEKNLIKTETVCIGKRLTEVVNQILQSIKSKSASIDFTICDQNGETYRADEFGFMLSRTNEHFLDWSDYLVPADCWGDVGAASGPLYVSLIGIAAPKEYSKGPNTLIWTSSESGERSAAIIRTKLQKVDA